MWVDSNSAGASARSWRLARNLPRVPSELRRNGFSAKETSAWMLSA